MSQLIQACGGAAGVAGGGFQELNLLVLATQTIPNNAETQLLFDGVVGPVFGDGSIVEGDATTHAIRFNYDNVSSNLRLVRLAGVWAAAAGVKRLRLVFAASGTVGLDGTSYEPVATYQPYDECNNALGYQECVTTVTPFIFSNPADFLTMTAYAYQNTGGALALTTPVLQVSLPLNSANVYV